MENKHLLPLESEVDWRCLIFLIWFWLSICHIFTATNIVFSCLIVNITAAEFFCGYLSYVQDVGYLAFLSFVLIQDLSPYLSYVQDVGYLIQDLYIQQQASVHLD